MANMSYCRFENTIGDVRDCANALGQAVEDGESLKSFVSPMSDYERRAVLNFRQVLESALEALGELEEADERELEEEERG